MFILYNIRLDTALFIVFICSNNYVQRENIILSWGELADGFIFPAFTLGLKVL